MVQKPVKSKSLQPLLLSNQSLFPETSMSQSPKYRPGEIWCMCSMWMCMCIFDTWWCALLFAPCFFILCIC